MNLFVKKFTPFVFALAIIFGAFAISAAAQTAKPTVVVIKATWCGACQKVEPIMMDLMKEYDGKLNFVVLDVSDETAEAESAAKAQSLGLSEYFAANKKNTSQVAVFKGKKIVFKTMKNYDREAYVGGFNKALK